MGVFVASYILGNLCGVKPQLYPFLGTEDCSEYECSFRFGGTIEYVLFGGSATWFCESPAAWCLNVPCSSGCTADNIETPTNDDTRRFCNITFRANICTHIIGQLDAYTTL